MLEEELESRRNEMNEGFQSRRENHKCRVFNYFFSNSYDDFNSQ